MPRTFKPRCIPCRYCSKFFTNQAGLTNHVQSRHRKPNLVRKEIIQQPQPSPPLMQPELPEMPPYDPDPSPTHEESNFGTEDSASIPRREFCTSHPLLNGITLSLSCLTDIEHILVY